jgi:hypothetical protein
MTLKLEKTVKGRLNALRVSKIQMVAYLYAKLADGDFHAIADAAMDIREIERETRVLDSVYESLRAAKEPSD